MMNIEDLNNIFNQIHKRVEAKKLCLKVCGSYGIYLSSNFLKTNLIGNKLQLNIQNNIPDYFIRNYITPRDIDFVSVAVNKPEIENLFFELGFLKDKRFDTVPGIKRSIFYNSEIKVDVFYDGFDFNHFIDLTISAIQFLNGSAKSGESRIATRGLTIPVTELLLQKLQIVKPGQKDLVDAWWILFENEISNEDNINSDEKIILPLINFYTSRQWGFYKTVLQNLNSLKVMIDAEKVKSDNDSDMVSIKIELITNALQSSPKSFLWNARSVIGSNMKWYNEVDEI